MKNKQTVRRRVGKLKEYNKRARFQDRVKKLADVEAPNICMQCFKNGI